MKLVSVMHDGLKVLVIVSCVIRSDWCMSLSFSHVLSLYVFPTVMN